ncbi:hypothetical protein COT96_03055, partial [Candidatus Falkowbacteria bacterium CG10_big_fil_rev_8_21_14_0_10_38_22]
VSVAVAVAVAGPPQPQQPQPQRAAAISNTAATISKTAETAATAKTTSSRRFCIFTSCGLYWPPAKNKTYGNPLNILTWWPTTN